MGALCGAERDRPKVEQSTSSAHSNDRRDGNNNNANNSNNNNSNNNGESGRPRSASNSSLRRMPVPDGEEDSTSNMENPTRSDFTSLRKQNKQLVGSFSATDYAPKVTEYHD